MRKDSFLYRVYDLYADGFRSMRLGRTLWAIILIKLFIIFVVLTTRLATSQARSSSEQLLTKSKPRITRISRINFNAQPKISAIREISGKIKKQLY